MEKKKDEKQILSLIFFQMFTKFCIDCKREKESFFFLHFSLSERERKMTILIMLLLMLFAVLDAQTLPQSDIQLSDSSEKFQPANSIELLETLSVSSLLQCGYGKNEYFH
jgi:hypothetical protein